MKTEPAKLVPISFINLKVKQENFTFKALFDSGASCTLSPEATVRHLKKTRNDTTAFSTPAEKFATNQKCRIKMTLAEFNPTAEIMRSVHVAENLGSYNIIIGWDLLYDGPGQ